MSSVSPVINPSSPITLPKVVPTIGTQITIQSLLGKGAYGTVYSCQDEFGARLAIKCIETDASGVPCLMETSIMSVIHHPSLQRALSVYAAPKMLYIVSELAHSDLSSYTHNRIVPPSLLRKWAFALIQGVACLHRKDIIHGDLKASNVLLFDDEMIRITDFTLSVKRWDTPRTHTVCTATHRPLEVWLNREWDTPVDIWALGCTLYEIAYGSSLFPYQGKHDSTLRESPCLRERSVNCILDWADRGPGGKQRCNVSRSEIDYITFQLSERYNHPDYASFNQLILSMLRVDASDRPTAVSLLSSPYFTGCPELSISPFMIVSTPTTPLSDRDMAKLTRLISRFTNVQAVINFTLELYSRILGLSTNSQRTSLVPRDDYYVKLVACYWIAAKLILRKCGAIDIPLNDVLQMERAICFHLSFRLHVPSNNTLYVTKT